jgi:hypothetical protein
MAAALRDFARRSLFFAVAAALLQEIKTAAIRIK